MCSLQPKFLSFGKPIYKSRCLFTRWRADCKNWKEKCKWIFLVEEIWVLLFDFLIWIEITILINIKIIFILFHFDHILKCQSSMFSMFSMLLSNFAKAFTRNQSRDGLGQPQIIILSHFWLSFWFRSCPLTVWKTHNLIL